MNLLGKDGTLGGRTPQNSAVGGVWLSGRLARKRVVVALPASKKETPTYLVKRRNNELPRVLRPRFPNDQPLFR